MNSEVDGYFNDLDSSYYKQGNEAIERRWEKCIELKENNVEKYIKTFPNFDLINKEVGYFCDHHSSRGFF